MPGSSWERLTPRQQQILERLTLGRSNCEIAQDLGVTRATVRNGISQIYREIEVDNRVRAMRWALESHPGLLLEIVDPALVEERWDILA